MKRLFMMMGVLALGTPLYAAGNSNPLPVSSGTFKSIDLYDNNSGGARQAIVIGDATSSTTLTVDSIKGIPVFLSSSTSNIGTVVISSANGVFGSTIAVTNAGGVALKVDGSAVTQPVSGTITANQGGTVWGSTVTFNGTQNVQLQTGANAIGSITNTSFAISTGGVTAAQGGNWTVSVATGGVTAVLGTGSNAIGSITNTSFAISTGGVTAAQGGTWTVQPGNTPNTSAWLTQITTGGVTAAQGGTWTVQPGNTVNTTPWFVNANQNGVWGTTVTFNGAQSVYGSTVTIMAPNNNTTAIPVTGSFSASSVNITTSAANGAMANALVNVAGVNAQGFAQTFAVDSSSRVQITGSISTTAGALSIIAVNASTMSVGYQTGTASVPVNVINTVPVTGTFFQTNQPVTVIQPTVLGATVTFNGTQNVQLQAGSALAGQVVINEPTILGATVTFNGTQNVQLQTGANIIGEVNNNGTIGFTVTPGTGTWSISQPDAINVVSTQTLANQGSAGVTDWPVRVSTVSVMVLISSATTMPAVHVDASSAPIMADQLGRIVTVAGAPTSVYQTTAPTTTSIGFMVLVASPASTVFTHVCGCIFNNSSATGVTAVIYPTGGVVNPHVTIQLPATDSRGIWPGCDEPFLNTVGGVQVSAKISASVSTVDGYCVFYQTNAP